MSSDPRILFGEKVRGLGPGPMEDVIPAGKLNVEKALSVYERGYAARLTDALGETYEAVWWCVGDENFKHLAEKYIQRYPSMEYNLSNYGDLFATFLRHEKLATEFAFLPDFAEFEWNFSRLFHAAEISSSVTKESLKGLSQDFNFRLASHTRLFRFDYAILTLWNAFKEQIKPTQWHKPESFLMFKQNNDLKIRELSLGEYFLLHFAQSNQSMDPCVQSVTELGLNLNPQEIQNLFAFLWEHRLIASLSAKCDA